MPVPVNVELVNILTIFTLSEILISRSSRRAFFQVLVNSSTSVDSFQGSSSFFLVAHAPGSSLSVFLELTEAADPEGWSSTSLSLDILSFICVCKSLWLSFVSNFFSKSDSFSSSLSNCMTSHRCCLRSSFAEKWSDGGEWVTDEGCVKTGELFFFLETMIPMFRFLCHYDTFWQEKKKRE